MAAVGLLPRFAAAQEPCPVLRPDCTTTTTTGDTTSTTRHVTTSTNRATTTTDDDSPTTTDDDAPRDRETPTTRAGTRTTEREQVTTSTLTVSTVHNVLIPGDGSAGAESTTTEPTAVAGGSSGLSDGALIAIVASGLAAVGLVASVLTWRYWSATRPRVAEAPPVRRTSSGSRSVFLD